MATFLDVTGLEYFSKIFVFLFVWLVVYAVLAYTKVLGNNQAVSILIGLILALLSLFVPVVTGAIQFIAPWFVLVFVFIILSTVALKTLGATPAELASYGALKGVLVVLIVVALLVGILSYVRDQTTIPGENESGTRAYSSAVSIIFHPKILGGILVLVIAVFTVALLAGKTS